MKLGIPSLKQHHSRPLIPHIEKATKGFCRDPTPSSRGLPVSRYVVLMYPGGTGCVEGSRDVTMVSSGCLGWLKGRVCCCPFVPPSLQHPRPVGANCFAAWPTALSDRPLRPGQRAPYLRTHPGGSPGHGSRSKQRSGILGDGGDNPRVSDT